MNKKEVEILKVIQYDIGCIDCTNKDKNTIKGNTYHRKLAEGNLKDIIKGKYKR